ncbi:MAG: hypothetical protein R6X17_06535 [Candidatus Competibacteraceae bacterium]
MALRQRLALILAGGALHADLVAAVLDRPTTEPPTIEVLEASQVQASQWIEATTQELARAWNGSSAGVADAGASTPAGQLSDEHRYEIARLLVDFLRAHPDGPTRIEPARLAAYLTAPETPRRAVAPDSGQRLAEARALARVLGAALRCDFQRELTTVLGEAWTALAGTAARQAESLDQAIALAPEARRIAWQRLLDVGGALYAATLARVHHDSVRMIQAYQDCLNGGDVAGADRLARAYQERRLGYAGIPHYFQVAVELIDRWVRAALAVAEEPAIREVPATEPGGAGGGATRRRRTAPAAPGGGGNGP